MCPWTWRGLSLHVVAGAAKDTVRTHPSPLGPTCLFPQPLLCPQKFPTVFGPLLPRALLPSPQISCGHSGFSSVLGKLRGQILWGRVSWCYLSSDLFPNYAITGLLSADATREPLAPLGPTQPLVPRGTPTSLSSASSTDGDLDFRSPGGNQGQHSGKGEPEWPTGESLQEPARGSCPHPLVPLHPLPEAELGILRQEQVPALSWVGWSWVRSAWAQQGQDRV